MSPIVRGTLAMLLAPGLNLETFGKYRLKPEEYRRLNNVQNSRRAYEESARLDGFGPLAKKGELETTILDEPIRLPGQRFIHETYALGFAVSKEMQDDEQYGVMRQLAGELGKSSRFTVELFGHDVWNHAFDTLKYVGRDGKALVADDHPLAFGGTASNLADPPADLDQTSLEAAIQSFDEQVSERGMPIDLQPTYLVVSPQNEFLARRLLMSAGYPGGNLNDINPIQGRLQIIVSHYLTDKDAWFVIAPPSDLGVKFFWREMPDTKTWDDDDADAVFHKIRQRHSVGFDDWRGVWGSPGA